MKNNLKKPRILALISAVVLTLVISFAMFRGQSTLSIASAAEVVGINKYLYSTSNLIPYPYQNSGPTGSNTGLVYNQNDDYSVTFNGTTTKLADYIFFQGNIDYSTFVNKLSLSLDVLSGSWTGSSEPYLQVYLNGQYTGSATPSKGWKNENIPINGRTMTRVILYFPSGTTLSDFTVRPMLNPGTVAYPFSPYYLLGYNEGFDVGLDFNLYDVFGRATFNAVVRPVSGTSGSIYTYNNQIPNYYSTPGIGFSSFYADYISSNSNIIANDGANYELTLDITFAKPFDYLNTAPFAIRSPYQYPVNDHSDSEQYITIINRGNYTLVADYNQTQNFSTPFTFQGYFAEVFNVDSLRIRIENPYKYLKDFYLIRQNANDTLVYDKGYQDGYDQGYTNGSGDGFEQGFEQGKYDGYDIGYDKGYDDAQEGAFDSGYDEGRSDGYRVGYDDGYSVGFGQNNTFAGLFYSVIDSPLSVFTQMFNFEFLGTNLSEFFLACVGIALVVCVIRWII